MSDVERFAVRKDALIRESEEFPPAFPHGYLTFVVLEAAHVAAVAAAEQRGREYDRWADIRKGGICKCGCYEQGQRDVFAFHPEWTVTDMCKPDCLPCQRLTELINERSAGYDEGQRDEREAAVGRVEAWLDKDRWAEFDFIRPALLAAIKGDSDA
jgi:hypothetical protein